MESGQKYCNVLNIQNSTPYLKRCYFYLLNSETTAPLFYQLADLDPVTYNSGFDSNASADQTLRYYKTGADR